MFSSQVSARVQLQGVPGLRAQRRAARRAPRREMRKQPMPRPPTAAVEAPKPPPIDVMRLVPHKDGWALEVDDISEPAWVVGAKKNAVQSAKDNARFHGATLKILTRSGKVQKTVDFGGADAS